MGYSVDRQGLIYMPRVSDIQTRLVLTKKKVNHSNRSYFETFVRNRKKL